MKQRGSALAFILLVSFLHFAAAPAAAQYTRWYLAEGATTPFFDTEILVANPNSTPVTLTLTFLAENSTPQPAEVAVAATSRKTIRLNDYAPNDAVSVIVDATANVLVERSMYWPQGSRRGGHHSTGFTAPALKWHFAEGSTNIFEQFVLVANPSPTQVANVRLTFLGSGGEAPVTIDRTIQPLRRDTVWINAMVARLRGASFSTVVESTNGVPVLAERAMYWGNYEGGHNAGAVPDAATTYRFAEGCTAAGFQTFFLLANPGQGSANVNVTFYPESGAPSSLNVPVAAGRRETVWVNAIPQNPNGSFSTVVNSDVPIVAERAMYWGNFVDGHTTAGSPVEAIAWGFAEGIEDAHASLEYDSYYLFANSTSTDATIEATFYRDDGTGIVDTFVVPAQKRYTLIPARYAALTYQKFAAFFRSVNAVPVVVERATYWGDGYVGGNGSIGTPWVGAIAAPPAPAPASVSSITPGGGPTTGGTSITLKGDNFARGTRVFIGGGEASNVRLADEQTITANAPGGSIGATHVVVTSNDRTATLSNAYTYEAVAPPPPPPPPTSAFDLSKVSWIRGRNVSNWAQTSTITGVEISSDTICVYHTRAGTWPTSQLGSPGEEIDVEGNVWIFAQVNGTWYGATYDWLRPGQECKYVTGPELGVDQIGVPPLDANWQPKSGDLVGFMVSTRARDSLSAGEERTDIKLVRWP